MGRGRGSLAPRHPEDVVVQDKAGYLNVAPCGMNFPYADSQYHLPGDVSERVNIDNVVRSTQLLLAAILEIDARGTDVFR